MARLIAVEFEYKDQDEVITDTLTSVVQEPRDYRIKWAGKDENEDLFDRTSYKVEAFTITDLNDVKAARTLLDAIEADIRVVKAEKESK